MFLGLASSLHVASFAIVVTHNVFVDLTLDECMSLQATAITGK